MCIRVYADVSVCMYVTAHLTAAVKGLWPVVVFELIKK